MVMMMVVMHGYNDVYDDDGGGCGGSSVGDDKNSGY
jgi:hypothetical protein